MREGVRRGCLSLCWCYYLLGTLLTAGRVALMAGTIRRVKVVRYFVADVVDVAFLDVRNRHSTRQANRSKLRVVLVEGVFVGGVLPTSKR